MSFWLKRAVKEAGRNERGEFASGGGSDDSGSNGGDAGAGSAAGIAALDALQTTDAHGRNDAGGEFVKTPLAMTKGSSPLYRQKLDVADARALNAREDIDLDGLKVTQALVHKESVRSIIQSGDFSGNLNDPIEILVQGDNRWVIEGHHRVSAAKLAGAGRVNVRVLRIPEMDDSPHYGRLR